MKKFFSFLLPLIVCANLNAQVTTSAKAGLSFASVHFKTEDASEQGRIAGYGGLSFNITLPNQFYFQPELLYSLRGYRFPSTGFNSNGRVAYGYITVPLLAGYKLSKTFSVLAGPELGYMIRARSHFDGTNHDILQNVSRRFNVDADAGIAWRIIPELVLETRFSFGVTALYRGILTDPQGNAVGDFKDGYHRVLQLGLALAL